MSTNMPPIVFSEAGAIFPEPDAVLAGACLDIQAAFNNLLYLDPDDSASLVTPQGQFAQTLTAARLEKDSDVNFMSSQFNPATCAGIWQDGMGALFYGMKRIQAASTKVDCVCVGVVGLTIPAGVSVSDTAGNIYVSKNAGIIGAGGNITIQFDNVETGPISASANSVTTIYNSLGIVGWDTVNNPAAGVDGQDVETPQAFEARRQLSLAQYGHSQLSSIVANIYLKAPGVTMVFAAENDTGSPLAILSYTLAAHSILLTVLGGVDADVARAIWEKKSAGAAYNGNTPVIVQDTDGYGTPYPSTTVKFERPAATNVYFKVTAVNSASLPANKETLIKDAIIARFVGSSGSAREVIGSLVSAGNYYAPVLAAIPGIIVNVINVGAAASPTGSSLQIGAAFYPTIQASNIAIVWV